MIVTIDTDKLVELLPEILERCKADAEPVPVPTPEPPSPPPAPAAAPITEKGRFNGTKNAPWWNFYFSKRLDEYPKEFILHIAKRKFKVVVGIRTTRPGEPGMDDPKNRFYVKQSGVRTRGMSIGIHEKFATKAVSITYTPK